MRALYSMCALLYVGFSCVFSVCGLSYVIFFYFFMCVASACVYLFYSSVCMGIRMYGLLRVCLFSCSCVCDLCMCAWFCCF